MARCCLLASEIVCNFKFSALQQLITCPQIVCASRESGNLEPLYCPVVISCDATSAI